MSALDKIFSDLIARPDQHVPGSAPYIDLKQRVRAEIELLFKGAEPIAHEFGPFGPVIMPYTNMGAIDSLDLFGIDELIIFAFYHANRKRYTKVLDIGANIGLHSIIMAKCGFEVHSYEPDPKHFAILDNNLRANGASRVQPVQAAVSTADGQMEFVRVLGNTTGSHLAGAKNSYGEREFFPVQVVAISPLLAWATFAKIDAEGHEKNLLVAATAADFTHLDIMVEVGSEANAEAIFRHLTSLGVGMFPQRLGWQRAVKAEDLPTSHRNGSLFISAKNRMPWN